jgi:hypothetical protein
VLAFAVVHVLGGSESTVPSKVSVPELSTPKNSPPTIRDPPFHELLLSPLLRVRRGRYRISEMVTALAKMPLVQPLFLLLASKKVLVSPSHALANDLSDPNAAEPAVLVMVSTEQLLAAAMVAAVMVAWKYGLFESSRRGLWSEQSPRPAVQSTLLL